MQHLRILLFCFIALSATGQRVLDKFDIHTWTPSYRLITPQGWTSERLPIPIDFAPAIPYKGVEDLRFTPGWGKQTSEEYWSYAFLWWLEGNPTINAASLQSHLTAYYSGLVANNVTSRKILPSRTTPTTVSIKKEKTTPAENDRYTGSITMLDYMRQSPITLHCQIQVTKCKEQKRTAVFFELSPKPAEHKIWQQLHTIQRNFLCTKK
ncbi:hypothetical protein [Spirosoma gilvum]